jgi:hypothetical protein
MTIMVTYLAVDVANTLEISLRSANNDWHELAIAEGMLSSALYT